MLFPVKRVIRGVKVSSFTSYVEGSYWVRANDTVDIKVTVSIRGPINEKGYVLSYFYTDPFFNSIENIRELLINPNLPSYRDYSLNEPFIVPPGMRVLKSFRLNRLKIKNNTKLFIYVTLPISTGIGHNYVETTHEIKINRR